ncbi:LINE-1 reverse transcriptase homolog [Linum grandiflorum]
MSMGANKPPGPDGFNQAFYQDFWDIMGPDVIADCHNWLSQAEIGTRAQATNIILLPKTEDPQTMKDLRPISLCNVRYRILAKVLANRLRLLMPDTIQEEQSAFVYGRSIIDNIMIAFESLHSMKTKPAAKVGSAALKIDICKAYDRIDWGYLEAIMRRMGYHETWIQWMMACVKGVSYSVIVNSDSFGNFRPSRGLRQGCPLSPFLFILCTEGLTAMIRQANLQGLLQGYRVCQRAPPVSHLLFADDSLFFFRATVAEARTLKDIFIKYARASGQLINYDKSGITFTKDLNSHLQTGIESILGVTHTLDTSRYLGVPILIGRNKGEAFAGLREKVWKRLQSWQGRKLSKARKEILIKAVVQALLFTV